eukprot:TRINITY_DN7956_c0_g1_i1.p1 TRINITY_DN7956_c0_g1~~TRINITY_DN7956_c0_g1_i1.p1  ORF type:complete len:249 (-),score=102.87 TRINITY_DN7956_c0_g1_i1:84-830(-)
MAPLSRLRLSPHFGAISAYNASESENPPPLTLDVALTSYTEVVQICKHFDLEYQVQPGADSGKQRISIKRSCEGPPKDEDEEDAEEAPGGDVLDLEEAPREVQGAGPAEAPGARAPAAPPPKKLRSASEAEKLLESDRVPKGLPEFYRALMDAFPGYQGPISKLLVAKLKQEGIYGEGFSDCSSSDSPKKKKKKMKKEKKEKKKAKKKAKKEAKKEKKAAKKEGRLVGVMFAGGKNSSSGSGGSSSDS